MQGVRDSLEFSEKASSAKYPRESTLMQSPVLTHAVGLLLNANNLQQDKEGGASKSNA
jgi:hypothetical protein